MPADVVLLGAGHTNVHILRMWRSSPPPGARLTCISDWPVATYSGMLPGVLAGQYEAPRMEIDLERLCAASGARLVLDPVVGLDHARQHLLFADRPPLRFDALSIGIGSVPGTDAVQIIDATRLVPIKPMQTLLTRLAARLRDAAGERVGAPIRIVTVGGGAGGVEVTMCLPPFVRRVLSADARFEITLVTADARLLPGSVARTAARVETILQRRVVRVRTGRRVARVDGAMLLLDDGSCVEGDVIIWVTGAAPPPLLGQLGLPTDDRGFLLTDDTLRTTSGDPIFAVGDTGTICGLPTPRAGVYAVRQGPVLWDNLTRILVGAPLRRYVPQRGFLKLLNTGNGRAIAEWRGMTAEGVWCWWLKDLIDRRFVAAFQDDMSS
jgi:selenide, water dikinase